MGEVIHLRDEPDEAFDAAQAFHAADEVARLDEQNGWEPSPDQDVALTTLLSAFEKPGVYVFTGAAGSGKTTVIKALLRRLTPAWDIEMLAPTWRAANRLREVTMRATSSIHRAIYGAPVQKRLCPCGEWVQSLTRAASVEVEVEGVRVKLPRYVCSVCQAVHEDSTRFPQRLDFDLKTEGGEAPGAFRLVVVDEAGMVSAKISRDLQRVFCDGRTRVLYVGDANQLKPVQEDKADTDGAVDLLHPTAALHRVHRQAGGSPALSLAHTLKVTPEMSTVLWPYPKHLPGVRVETRVPLDAPARWAASLRHEYASLALISYSNRTRATLNHLVRTYTGAVAHAHAGNANVIPGDRLLARGNGYGVYNGELFAVVDWDRVPNGTSLLNERGRMERRNPYYEHDRVLEAGVGVYDVGLSLVGNQTQYVESIMVCPLDSLGLPLLESDLIRAGMDATTARQRCREVARAWREEYEHGIEERGREWEARSADAQEKRIAGEQFMLAMARGNVGLARKALLRLEKAGGLGTQAWRVEVEGKIARGEALNYSVVLHGFATPYDAAIDCSNALEYCMHVYGALDPARVVVCDFGEALTCHSMQGDQAENVGVVFDSAFWGSWRHSREDALRFAYTAITRTTQQLALFGIAR